jgi:hypothetical protein
MDHKQLNRAPDLHIRPYRTHRPHLFVPTRIRKKPTLHLNVPLPSEIKSWCGNVHNRKCSYCGVVTVSMCRPRTPVFDSPTKQIQQPRTKSAVMKIKRSSQPRRRTMKARAYRRSAMMRRDKKQKKPVTPSIDGTMSCARNSLLCIVVSRCESKPFEPSMLPGVDSNKHQRNTRDQRYVL